jgi:hypothetical protein
MSDISIITRLVALGKGDSASFERVSTHTDVDYRYDPTPALSNNTSTPVEQLIHSCGAEAAVVFQRARMAIRHLNNVERETAVAAEHTHYECRSYTLEAQVKCVPLTGGLRVITTVHATLSHSTMLPVSTPVPDTIPLEG